MNDSDLDIAKALDEVPLGPFQYGVIGMCFALVMIDGFDTQAIAFVAPALREAWTIAPNTFGLLFSAGLVGSMIGAMVLGMLGDRVGRRPLIIASTLLFSVMSLLSATADGVATLALYRFIAGLGLGGLLPNAIALVAEYSPRRVRSTAVVSTFIGFPLGAVLGGMASAQIVPVYGWETVFIAGGVLPLAVLAVVLFKLPESLRFLVRRPGGKDRVVEILGRFRSDLAGLDADAIREPQVQPPRQPLQQLFLEGRGSWTLCLWLLAFSSLLLTYFLVHWIPLVLVDAGVPQGKAIMGVALLNLGGIFGSLVIGRISDRRGPYLAMGLPLAFAIVFVAAIGLSVEAGAGVVLSVIFFAGVTFVGMQLNISALAATNYPVAIRSAGTGWSIAAGRVGSIVGPLVGGALVAIGIGIDRLFLVAAVPAAVALVAVIAMARIKARSPLGPAD
jgi:AAHS family 4-hydroxybenzoate transporter-like MFS transporter